MSSLVLQWEALATTRATCDQWLISDPLRFAEFEITRRPPLAGGPGPVEADLCTRPKQSGGMRVELYPDIYTLTFLQTIAARMVDATAEGPALSARALQRSTGVTAAYDVWRDSVLKWVREQLGAGLTVFVADIRNFFPSIALTSICVALSEAGIDPADVDRARMIIEQLDQAASQPGLPVVPADFFWVVSDLVLRRVDAAIDARFGMATHVRWVDDFFVAVRDGFPAAHDGGEDAVAEFDRILNRDGFESNKQKLKVLKGPQAFEQEYKDALHKSLDGLFRTGLPASERTLESLFDELGHPSAENARLAKRLYNLAGRYASRVAVPRVEHDLTSFPTAEVAILAYAGAVGWPEATWDSALGGLRQHSNQQRLLATLRSVIQFPPPEGLAALLAPILEKFILDPDRAGHPFATALAIGYFLKTDTPQRFQLRAEAALPKVPTLPSALSRRASYEFLYAGTLSPSVLDGIADDPSRVVRGLQALIEARSSPDAAAIIGASIRRLPRSQLNWGGVDRLVAERLFSGTIFPSADG